MRKLLALLALPAVIACSQPAPPGPAGYPQPPAATPLPLVSPPITPPPTPLGIYPYPEPAAYVFPTTAPTPEGPMAGAPTLTRTISLSDPPIGGDDVRVVQERLAWLGYTTPTDGRFGPDTAAALRRFQLVNGLFADGIIEWTAYSRLFSLAAIPGAPLAALLDAETGILIGGSARGNWLTPEQTAALLPQGVALTLYSPTGQGGEITIGAPAPEPLPCGAPRFTLPPGQAGLAMLSPWPAQPRVVAAADPQPAVEGGLLDLLLTSGLPQARVRLIDLFVADLDGAGLEEYIFSAADQIPIAEGAQIGLDAGSYRFFGISSPAGSAHYDGAPLLLPAPAEPPGRPSIAGVLDLDGDGSLEVVARTTFVDGVAYAVYTYQHQSMQRVIELSCRT